MFDRRTVAIYDYSITLSSIVTVFGFPEGCLLLWGQRVAMYKIYVIFYEHMRERSKSSAICNAVIDF